MWVDQRQTFGLNKPFATSVNNFFKYSGEANCCITETF